jgi:hypothetical protein
MKQIKDSKNTLSEMTQILMQMENKESNKRSAQGFILRTEGNEDNLIEIAKAEIFVKQMREELEKLYDRYNEILKTLTTF